jgi:hypothetical protein
MSNSLYLIGSALLLLLMVQALVRLISGAGVVATWGLLIALPMYTSLLAAAAQQLTGSLAVAVLAMLASMTLALRWRAFHVLESDKRPDVYDFFTWLAARQAMMSADLSKAASKQGVSLMSVNTESLPPLPPSMTSFPYGPAVRQIAVDSFAQAVTPWHLVPAVGKTS